MKGKKLKTWKNQHLQVLTNWFEVFKNGFKIFENRFLAVEKSVQKTTILGSDFQYSQWSTAVQTYIIVKYIFWRTQNRWKQNCRRLPLWIIIDFWSSEKSDFASFSSLLNSIALLLHRRETLTDASILSLPILKPQNWLFLWFLWFFLMKIHWLALWRKKTIDFINQNGSKMTLKIPQNPLSSVSCSLFSPTEFCRLLF